MHNVKQAAVLFIQSGSLSLCLKYCYGDNLVFSCFIRLSTNSQFQKEYVMVVGGIAVDFSNKKEIKIKLLKLRR